MDIYAQIAEKIIESQEAIIGPVAVEQAQQVAGLQIDWKNHQVAIVGDGVAKIDDLVRQYEKLFGQISVQVSKEAAHPFTARLTDGQLPHTLQ